MKPARVDTSMEPAQVCVWCKRPHYLTREDAIRRAMGARLSHGMCELAAKRMREEIDALCPGGHCLHTHTEAS